MENNKSPMSKGVDLIFIAKKIRILGIAIIIGMAVVFGFGLTVAGKYVNEELAPFGLVSFIICTAFCLGSFYFRKTMLKNLGGSNFVNKYFNGHVIPFAMCDFGGLLCVATNLFVNSNIIYASAGFFLSVIFMILNFPRNDDYEKLKSL